MSNGSQKSTEYYWDRQSFWHIWRIYWNDKNSLYTWTLQVHGSFQWCFMQTWSNCSYLGWMKTGGYKARKIPSLSSVAIAKGILGVWILCFLYICKDEIMVGQELLHTGRLDIYLEIVETDVVIVIVWHIIFTPNSLFYRWDKNIFTFIDNT